MDRSDVVRFDEAQQLLRLVVELRDVPAADQKAHALTGLARLVDAQVGLWVEVAGLALGQLEVELGWTGAAERRAFHAYLEREQYVAPDPTMAPLARCAAGATVLREHLIDDTTWYASDHAQTLRRAANVDSFIYSTHTSGAAFSLHRPWRAPRFSERERRLVELFHRECGFLHATAPVPLPPRLRATLALLARGLSEKQIAAELGLSPHTVHDYVKALHRRFGVQSRGELLARAHKLPQ